MSDDLLPYYARELAILRTLAADFAQRHPKVAGRLSLGRDDSQDPHVERLLQGVAFLAADVQKRLDDDFPELTDALLDLLYPHYLRPVPSMTIVEMAIDRKQAALTSGGGVRAASPPCWDRAMMSWSHRSTPAMLWQVMGPAPGADPGGAAW